MAADISAAAQRWCEQLVDLTGRNNLLFYRRLKVGTLELAGADPGPLGRLLSGGTIRSSELAADPDDAARRLRVIAKTAAANFEEKGTRTSRVALGLATWDQSGPTTPNAPVLLAPLSVTPRGVGGAEWDLTVDGDWEVNPTLLFKLRNDFGSVVEVPEGLVPELDEFTPETVEAALLGVAELLAEVPGFQVVDAAFVGNFSYSRMPMVEDLQRSVEAMAGHPMVKALAGDRDAAGELLGRHPEVGLDLPDRTPPHSEFIVVDADSSQHYVVNAAVGGADLVVQGPPGTGKSQTIANLIAALVASRKSVLFVAQKRAAIEAVTKRLDGVGLANLVMDLHDGTGSRRRVAGLLAEALATVGEVPAVDRSVEDAALVAQRDRLNAHSRAMNAPRDPWGVSVFELQAELLDTDPASGAGVRIPPDRLAELVPGRVQALSDELEEWVNLGGPTAGDPAANPWAAVAGRVRSLDDAQALAAFTDNLLLDALPSASSSMDALCADTGLQTPSTAAAAADVLQLAGEASTLSARTVPEFWDADLSALVAALEPATSGPRAVAATVFSPSYRRAKKAAAALCTDGTDDADDLRSLLVDATGLQERWSAAADRSGSPVTSAHLAAAQSAHDILRVQLEGLAPWVGPLDEVPHQALRQRLEAMSGARDRLLRLPRVAEIETDLRGAGLDAVLTEVAEKALDADEASRLLQVVWGRCVLDLVVAQTPEVAAFSAPEQDRRRGAFAAADTSQVAAGRLRVQRAWAEWVNDTRNQFPDQERLVAREAAKKSRHKALRELFEEAPDLLKALRPCWTMSPLVVSQLLPTVAGIFDVVVFDEASQVLPAEAIPALLRGKRAVVAGDAKQLPPTTFFDSSTSVEDLEGSDVDAVTDDMESILDAMSALLPPPLGSRTLSWHYRSRDERLIAFSNAQDSLYRGSMTTFPGVVPDAVTHVRVDAAPDDANEDSVAEEVRTVVDIVAEHARTRPGESLGVIALGLRHADRIDLALRDRANDDDVLRHWLEEVYEPMFVKNLERVQGDERDAVVLSLGFGKGANGQVRHQFGPINQAGGERRLNVAVTRARRRITLVSSFGSNDLDPSRLNSEGPRMLRRYIEFAESGGTNLGTDGPAQVPMNPFEYDIYQRLTAEGIPVHSQFGVSGYRIDFALAHPDRPGQMVLAVEADGASYHSSPTARDRDRLRQEHLERLGWTFCRIWSTNWFRSRDEELARVKTAWENACRNADREEVPAQPEPRNTSPDPPAAAAPPRRDGYCPVRATGGPITDYRHEQLVALVRWIRSDTLLRSDDEIVVEVMAILGFQRRGPRIVSAIEAAVAAAP